MEKQGSIIGTSSMECPLEKHLQPDSSITLSISFNGVEYFQVTDSEVPEKTLSLATDTRVYPAVPRYGIDTAADSLYEGVMQQ